MTTPHIIWLFLHLISLVIGFGAVIVIDTAGLLWLTTRVSLEFVIKVATITQKLIWLGWVGLVISGLGLVQYRTGSDNLFIIKMFAVTLLGLNGVFLYSIHKKFEQLHGTEVPARLQFKIGLASFISQVSWWTAIIIGFLHHEVAVYFSWPHNPYTIIISGTLGVLILLIASEFIRPKSGVSIKK